ncbi:MAG: hypothetical protein LBD58_06275 [Treponema sp.]|jgi:acetylglutamate kinase|nr:hypothetical protein [Treponema sp.]
MSAGNAAMLREIDRLQSDSREISGGMEEMLRSAAACVNENAGQVSVLAANASPPLKTSP